MIRTGTEAGDELLNAILTGNKIARITKEQLAFCQKSSVGLFAISYRHQGTKGKNITRQLWNELLSVCNAVAGSAGMEYYSLWIDSVSAAAKDDKPTQVYVDWFTIGVAPYLLLPTVILADESERRQRMWLRLEEKLSHYGRLGVYAVRHAGKIIRLEPGPAEFRERRERIWCLCQSVLRGEYNGLKTSYKKDYLSLLKWATEFGNSKDCRGLKEICGGGHMGYFCLELPIETGCYVVQEDEARRWLRGAEVWGGKLELCRLTKDQDGIERYRIEATGEKEMLIVTMTSGKILLLCQAHSRNGGDWIKRKRWRSYADSTMLLGEVSIAKDRRVEILRTVVVGAAYESCEVLHTKLEGQRLEVIPSAALAALGIENAKVRKVVKTKEADLFDKLTASDGEWNASCRVG